MTTPTANYGWGKPADGGDFDVWGVELNAVIDAVDSQVKAIADLAGMAAPTGAVMDFLMSLAPAGWVVLDGSSIGDAASGGTGRANADTAALFALLWANFDNGLLPIQNSDGTAGTRGAAAAADFAAHKRLPLIDQRDRFRRSYKAGGSSAAIGVAQADAFQGHAHAMPNSGENAGSNGVISAGVATSSFTAPNTGNAVTDGVDGTPRTAAETRPANIAYLTCIKL